MQISLNVSVDNIIEVLGQMSLNEIEKVKNALIEREVFLKEFQKDSIENIMDDFKKEDYSNDFLKELEDGLKKSSVFKDEN